MTRTGQETTMKTTWETEGTQRRLVPKHLLSALSMVTATVAISAATALPAEAGHDEVIRRGNCSGHADWKLKAKSDDGRIEVEGEVDVNRNGQTWKWRILHNGNVSVRGTARTHAPSGSFSIERRIINARGTDSIGWWARNPASGQVCRGSLRF
jgi:hypothetical protein